MTMKFQEDFDFLMTLSNTRKSLFISLTSVVIAFSILVSMLIIFEKVLVDYLNNVFGFRNIVDPFHFWSPYLTDNPVMQYTFFLMLAITCSMFSLLMGSLFYRFGKLFTLAFWLLFSATPTVLFPLLLWTLHQQGHLSDAFMATTYFLRNFDLWQGSVWLLVIASLFGLLAYLNINRLEQK
jgi:hypothetical protein